MRLGPGGLFSALAALAVGALVLNPLASAGSTLPAGTARAATAYERKLASEVGRALPLRNLYRLANELILRPPRHIPRVVRTHSPNYAVGHQDDFWVLSEDNFKYFRMHATIQARTPHLYIYVQNGLSVDKAGIRRAAQTFENHTYPTDRALFGSEWLPGVDGDPHITCLVGDLQSGGIAGAFSSEDEYPALVNPYSNQRELIYINTSTLPGTTDFDLTLAHEFQHMIHWHIHPRDNAWWNEGMSVLAQRVNHYTASDYASAFVASPNTQMDAWNANGDNSVHYGAAYLFMDYLYERFGPRIIRTMAGDSRYTDFPLVSDALRKLGFKLTAENVYADWIAANMLDSQPGRYGYKALPQPVGPTGHLKISSASGSQTAPYAAEYYALSNLQNHAPFRLSFAGDPTIPLIAASTSRPFWWSERGDISDTRLQRSVDLSKVKQAHLHFRLWYDIEDGYDFGYVEASMNGGRTWTTLQGVHTTRDKRTGANYGSGYTGSSKGWVNETVDLSRYAGRRILLRFEYVTDDEVNLQGMLLQNVSIPEVGFHDNFSGWHADGFVPVLDNSIPASWHVRLIAYTSQGPRVSTLPLGTNQTGSVLIRPRQEQLKKLVVAFFVSAPKTTATAGFKVSASG